LAGAHRPGGRHVAASRRSTSTRPTNFRIPRWLNEVTDHTRTGTTTGPTSVSSSDWPSAASSTCFSFPHGAPGATNRTSCSRPRGFCSYSQYSTSSPLPSSAGRKSGHRSEPSGPWRRRPPGRRASPSLRHEGADDHRLGTDARTRRSAARVEAPVENDVVDDGDAAPAHGVHASRGPCATAAASPS